MVAQERGMRGHGGYRRWQLGRQGTRHGIDVRLASSFGGSPSFVLTPVLVGDVFPSRIF
jgi:hypothetical protein